MIFDSEEMKSLRSAYKEKENYEVPQIILLDRAAEFSDERTLLEEIISEVNTRVQKEWLKGILNTDDGNHLGMWFEMMLYKWLKTIGTVTIKPGIQGNVPDFGIIINGINIYLEAKVERYKKNENDLRNYEGMIFNSLRKLEIPIGIVFEQIDFSPELDLNDLNNKISNWLNENPRKKFIYHNKSNDEIIKAHSVFNTTGIMSIKWFHVDSERFVEGLINKSEQHKNIHQLGFPYVVAIYIESPLHSADDVVDAWLGNRLCRYDRDFAIYLGDFFNKIGASFENGNPIHQYVSGLLVFKNSFSPDFHGRNLKAWYIENTQCDDKYSIPPEIFPTFNSFIKVGERDGNILMKWKNNSRD